MDSVTQRGNVEFWVLDVTVLRAENILKGDYMSEADCYVMVSLPSQTSKVCRTKTVANCRDPEWNETFSFTINDDEVKSTLEICLYDEDSYMKDDLISTISFDISSLTAEEEELKELIADHESNGKLWVSFKLRESQRRESRVRHHDMGPSAKENIHYWNLNVTILSAEIHGSDDFLSKCDAYIILALPTATAMTHRTKTVSNNDNPVWNETFAFRIPSGVKNVLEIRFYDEDPLAPDDLISTLVMDLSTLTEGQKETKNFSITPGTDSKLLIEFELLKSDDPSSQYLSNGVLMGAPFAAVDVTTEKLKPYDYIMDKMLTLKGAWEEKKVLHTEENPKLRFYINRDLETEITVAPIDSSSSVGPVESSVKLESLPPKQVFHLPLVLDQDEVDLEVETHECEGDPVAVRMDFDIPQEEKTFLKKRSVVVAKALQKLLGLDTQPDPEKVPTIALVASGGGSRAMTGLLGHLRGLKDMDFLDAVTYISSLSGSTWTLATLYQKDDWSQQNMEEIIAAAKEQMTKNILSAFSLEKMEYYTSEMVKKENDGYLVSLIDMAGLIIEHIVFGKKVTNTLSEQKRAVEDGQNPLPIYNSVNVKDGIKGLQFDAEWCEFTPYEVGLAKYGAFVQTEDFGSQFFLGHLINKLPELRISFLLGIWSSIFSINVTQMWVRATGLKPRWIPWLGPDVTEIEEDAEPETLDTTAIDGMTDTSSILTNFLKDRPVIAEMYNIIRGLFLHWDYSKSSNFLAWKDMHPDAFPNQLTPSDPTLKLIDAGHAINIGCMPVLRPQRDVDVLITLSYSWDSDIFMVLKKTAAYCKDHNIPFPYADYDSLAQEPKEVYIIEDQQNPEAPVVVHFPLVNVTFKDFKSPGVKRSSEEEVRAGQVDVSSSASPFITSNMTYSEEDFQGLMDLMTYNILNNKESVLRVLRQAVEKKASRIKK